jgi:hypothetical protein
MRHTISDLGLCGCPRLLLELLGEWLVIEEYPRVVELVIPCPLQVAHALQHIVDFFVAHQRYDGGIYTRAVRIIRCIIVAVDSAQWSGWFTRSCVRPLACEPYTMRYTSSYDPIGGHDHHRYS